MKGVDHVDQLRRLKVDKLLRGGGVGSVDGGGQVRVNKSRRERSLVDWI